MKSSKITLIFAMLIFGSIGLFVRNINLPSTQIALARGVIGSVFIFFISYVTRRKISWKSIQKNLLLLIISGAAIGFNWILLFESYKYTTIANATLSYYCAPIFVTLLSPFILKEKLTISNFLCTLAAMFGMYLLVGVGTGSTQMNHLLGIGYGLAAAGLYAGVVLINKFIKSLTGIETTLMQLSIATFILLPYILFTEPLEYVKVDTKSLLILISVGILNTGIAYLLYFSSMANLKAQTIAVYSYIDPIFAIVLSSIFLRERMTLSQIIGGVFILGSTLISEILKKSEDVLVENKDDRKLSF